MPFGHDCEYSSFDDCVSKNSDKDSPEGFCATLMEETEEQCNMAKDPDTEVREDAGTPARLPDIDVCRTSSAPNVSLRAKTEGAGMPTMEGHFSTFDDWYEINSWIEGNFMERIAPGAFKRTFNAASSSKDKHRIQVLLEHGHDPTVADKPLGVATRLEEDRTGAHYEVDLFDTSYVRDLVPALEAGVYGSSFRFAVIQDEWNEEPEPSDENPRGIPERTIKEVRVPEFGPTVFPANPSATAGMRSTTDEYYENLKRRDPSKYEDVLRSIAYARGVEELLKSGFTPDEALSAVTNDDSENRESQEESANTDSQVEHSDDSRSAVESSDDSPAHSDDSQNEHSETDENRNEVAEEKTATATEKTKRNEDNNMSEETNGVFEVERKTVSERESRVTEIDARLKEINTEYDGAELPEDVQEEWDGLRSERTDHLNAIEAAEERARQLEEMDGGQVSKRTERASRAGGSTSRTSRKVTAEQRTPKDVYNLAEYRSAARTLDDLSDLYRVGARRAVEEATVPGHDVDEDKAKQNALRLLDTVDDKQGTLAQRFLTTGSAIYQRAFFKAVLAGSDGTLSTEERAALAAGSGGTGGFAVPFTLDPSVILTSDGSINPLRQISRNVQITTTTWQGITSAGITVSRAAEGDEAGDDAPTLVQPEATPTRVQGFVPFSMEIDQDWSALRSEMTALLNDAKEQEEAASFITGDGTGVNPGGVVATLDSGSEVDTASSTTFASADVYALEEALAPRFRQRARFLANKAVYNHIRQFASADGHDLWERLGNGMPAALLGYPAHESSNMSSTVEGAGEKILLFGDFNQFVIVDRVGMNVELVPHLFGSSNRFPTGQRGLYATWRNTSLILADNAFRLLNVSA